MIEELSEFSNRFSTSARKCFETFEQYVKNDNSGVPPDGTVHELTSNACAFLKRLCDYKDSLVLFWKQKDYESKRKDMDLGKFIGNFPLLILYWKIYIFIFKNSPNFDRIKI